MHKSPSATRRRLETTEADYLPSIGGVNSHSAKTHRSCHCLIIQMWCIYSFSTKESGPPCIMDHQVLGTLAGWMLFKQVFWLRVPVWVSHLWKEVFRLVNIDNIKSLKSFATKTVWTWVVLMPENASDATLCYAVSGIECLLWTDPMPFNSLKWSSVTFDQLCSDSDDFNLTNPNYTKATRTTQSEAE